MQNVLTTEQVRCEPYRTHGSSHTFLLLFVTSAATLQPFSAFRPLSVSMQDLKRYNHVPVPVCDVSVRYSGGTRHEVL